MENQEPKKKKKFYKRWWVWAIVTVVIFIIIGISNNSKPEKVRQNTANNEVLAINENQKSSQLDKVVKQIISSYLKSPGSAQFAELIIKKKNNTENQYIAFGDVDSQNSFGGLMRSHFFLEIIDKGGDMQNRGNWTINSLDLGDFILISNGKSYDIPLSLSDLSEEARLAQKQVEDYYRGLK